MQRVIISMLVLAVSSQAPADLITPVPVMNIRDDQATADVTDPAGLYASVGLLQAPGFLATGTLIGPQWVLTAAHVVGSGTPDQYTFQIGGQTYVGAEIIREPTWTGSLFAGNDIALLRLANPVTNVAPAPLHNGAASELGQTGTLVGYGFRGTGSTPNTLPQGTRHIGQNVIDATGDMINNGPDPAFDERILFSDFDSPTDPTQSLFGSPVPIDLESNVAGGDSGGALFINFGNGMMLVGVNSFLGQGDGTADGDYGDVSGFTRLADHLAFIESNTGITPASVPEPGTCLLLASVLAAFGIFNRKPAMSSQHSEK